MDPALARGSASALRSRVRLLQAAAQETPIRELDEPGLRLYAKLEFHNLVGSIKDRPALHILAKAIERGEVDESSTVIESSSGNFALALAHFCRFLSLPFVAVIDPNISPVSEAVLRSVCARVEKVEERDSTGSFLQVRLARVQALVGSIPGAFWTNQYGNPDGMEAHYQLTAGEVCKRLPSLDYAFIGVSSAGTVSGVSRRLKERYPGVKVIAVDAEGSVIFGGPPKKRLLPGIGASVVPRLLSYAQIDDVVRVPERAAVRACRQLFQRHRILAGASTGSVFAAIQTCFGARRGDRTPSVLFFCADRGTAYLDTVYDDTWASRLEAAR